ncbi:hypothetical protein [Bacillus sp. 1P06AnD]|uniref:hypothetical protein n=1 Tax=Bacillus sp. 1P06AnD TaxID=3132208 RepID=UPI0039A15A29
MFKNKRGLIILLLCIILAAALIFFLVNNRTNDEKTHTSSTSQSHEKKKENVPVTDEYGPEKLTSEGQKIKQKNWGTYTLLKDYTINQTFNVYPMSITVKNVRIISMDGLTDDTKELLSQYTGLTYEEAMEAYQDDHLSMEEMDQKVAYSKSEIDDKGIAYIELTYQAKNTSTKEIQFFSLERVTFNPGGTSYDVPDKNFIFSEDTFMGTSSVSKIDYRANEERKGIVGLLNDRGENLKDLTSFTFTTSPVSDGDSHAEITPAKTFTIQLK